MGAGTTMRIMGTTITGMAAAAMTIPRVPTPAA